MTQLEDELRTYIRENIMSPTTLLLIKEIGIPILIEYLDRKGKPAASKLVEVIAKDPEILDSLPAKTKKNLINGLTDVISDLLDGLAGNKDKTS